jgi:hypothetical protein
MQAGRRVVLPLLRALFAAPLSARQSPATVGNTLAGWVLDPDVKIIQDATILIHNESTGEMLMAARRVSVCLTVGLATR